MSRREEDGPLAAGNPSLDAAAAGVEATGAEVTGAEATDARGRRVPVRVVLASQSPRRRDLLRQVGITAECVPANVDESVMAGEDPERYVERLARAKAMAVPAGDHALVVAADTTVVVDGRILGKPEDVEQARSMIGLLSGRTHTVFTALAVRHAGTTVTAVERVAVTFRDLDGAEIAAYVDTGEPMDKAGAYGIQGYGAMLVTRVEGDYFAVMGLPLARLAMLMRQVGVAHTFGPPLRTR